MNIALLRGYPDYMGKRLAWAGYGNGPAAYNPVTGDPIAPPFPRYGNYIDTVFDATAVSGNYKVRGIPAGVGPRQNWAIFWEYSGTQGVLTVAAVTPGSGQTNGVYTVNATGGGGTGAQAQVTIAGGAITQVLLLAGGRNYTAAPTFTVNAGGTAGTLTSTVAPATGPVPAGANLSGEQVQLGGFAGVY